jgi:hypothetical protein
MPVYVQHETLNRVSDVFNAEALWQAPGLALLNRRPFLRDLLERAPREQRGRAATRCFSHVTLVLPQDEVDDDRHLTRGARVRDLAQTLQALHQKDFGDLLGQDEVRYHVLGSDCLEPGQVEVKFGHAVYLPAPGEEVLYTVSVSRDSAIWQPLCPVYPNQRLTVLGGDRARATHAVPGWPFAADGNILLINDGPDAPLEVQVRPKEAFDCGFDAAGGYYTIRARGVETVGTPPRLLLKLTPARPGAGASTPRPVSAPPAPRAAAVWKTRAPGFDDAELTAVPVLQRAAAPAAPATTSQDATYAPVMRQRVSLAALALPRLSRYRDTGAAAIEFGIGRDLAVGPFAPDGLLGFALDANDALYAITANGRQRIAVPNRFAPSDGVDVRVLAPAPQMAERYSAIVCLPQAPGMPVPGATRHVFGRAAPLLAGLRVLDAGCLRGADGVEAAGADRLGLSRNAFGFEAGPEGYRVTRESATQALYHLDERFGLVAAIEPAPGEAYVLPLGHHIVAGHYVLRVEA